MTKQPTVPTATGDQGNADNLPSPIPGFVLKVPEQAITGAEAHRRAGYQFPDAGGRQTLYTKYLYEVPFVITSEARFGRKPAGTRPVYDKVTGVETGRAPVPEQDCVNFVVRTCVYDPEVDRWEYSEPQLAELTGVYLLNQVRGWLSDRERFSWLYDGEMKTIRRNKKFTTTGGDHPFMLDDYDRELDPAFKAENSTF